MYLPYFLVVLGYLDVGEGVFAHMERRWRHVSDSYSKQRL